jgi:uncharacterized protein
MDETTGWCRGCYRNIEEITVWAQNSDAEKRAVWQLLMQRHCLAAFPEAANHSGLNAVLQEPLR